MNQYLDTAYTVTSNLFGPETGIPWWAWLFVIVGFMWKLVIPEPRTARQHAEDRERMVLEELSAGNGGKKSKKK